MTHEELRTKRLLLRPFQRGDVAGAQAYRNDPEFALFLPHIPQPFTMQDAEDFVAQNMSESWSALPTFAVVLADKLIGTVNFEVDVNMRAAMLGYAIGRAWWGYGLATEAAQAAMTWVGATYDLTRVWASTDTRNIRSRRVLEKLGMRCEGLRMGDGRGRDGKPSDSVLYSLDFSGRRPAIPTV